MDTSNHQAQSHFQSEYTPWEKVLFYLSGAETDVVDSQVFSESDEDKLKNVGLAVLVGSVIAFANAFFLGKMLSKGTGSTIWYAVIFALFWGGMVFWNDRALFRTIEMKSLWWRVIFLIVSCLGISVGFQLWRADNQIVDKINLDAGYRNDALLAEMQAVRDKYDPDISDLNAEVTRIWADTTIKFKTRMAEPVKRQIEDLKAARDSAIAQKERTVSLRMAKPDYSFNRKFEVFRKEYAFTSFFDVLVGLMLILFEGWALWLRFTNRNMDYLKYIEVKRSLPKRVTASMSIDDKIQLYMKCQRSGKAQSASGNGVHQPPPNRGSDELFKPFDINEIEVP